MANTPLAHFTRSRPSQPIFLRTMPQTLRGVGQDNGAVEAPRPASAQPQSSTPDRHVRRMETILLRTQNRDKSEEKLEQITSYVRRGVKQQLQHIADQGLPNGDDLSMSAVVSAFVEHSLQGHTDMQYGALLKPVLEKLIRQEMHGFRSIV